MFKKCNEHGDSSICKNTTISTEEGQLNISITSEKHIQEQVFDIKSLSYNLDISCKSNNIENVKTKNLSYRPVNTETLVSEIIGNRKVVYNSINNKTLNITIDTTSQNMNDIVSEELLQSCGMWRNESMLSDDSSIPLAQKFNTQSQQMGIINDNENPSTKKIEEELHSENILSISDKFKEEELSNSSSMEFSQQEIFIDKFETEELDLNSAELDKFFSQKGLDLKTNSQDIFETADKFNANQVVNSDNTQKSENSFIELGQRENIIQEDDKNKLSYDVNSLVSLDIEKKSVNSKESNCSQISENSRYTVPDFLMGDEVKNNFHEIDFSVFEHLTNTESQSIKKKKIISIENEDLTNLQLDVTDNGEEEVKTPKKNKTTNSNKNNEYFEVYLKSNRSEKYEESSENESCESFKLRNKDKSVKKKQTNSTLNIKEGNDSKEICEEIKIKKSKPNKKSIENIDGSKDNVENKTDIKNSKIKCIETGSKDNVKNTIEFKSSKKKSIENISDHKENVEKDIEHVVNDNKNVLNKNRRKHSNNEEELNSELKIKKRKSKQKEEENDITTNEEIKEKCNITKLKEETNETIDKNLQQKKLNKSIANIKEKMKDLSKTTDEIKQINEEKLLQKKSKNILDPKMDSKEELARKGEVFKPKNKENSTTPNKVVMEELNQKNKIGKKTLKQKKINNIKNEELIKDLIEEKIMKNKELISENEDSRKKKSSEYRKRESSVTLNEEITEKCDKTNNSRKQIEENEKSVKKNTRQKKINSSTNNEEIIKDLNSEISKEEIIKKLLEEMKSKSPSCNNQENRKKEELHKEAKSLKKRNKYSLSDLSDDSNVCDENVSDIKGKLTEKLKIKKKCSKRKKRDSSMSNEEITEKERRNSTLENTIKRQEMSNINDKSDSKEVDENVKVKIKTKRKSSESLLQKHKKDVKLKKNVSSKKNDDLKDDKTYNDNKLDFMKNIMLSKKLENHIQQIFDESKPEFSKENIQVEPTEPNNLLTNWLTREKVLGNHKIEDNVVNENASTSKNKNSSTDTEFKTPKKRRKNENTKTEFDAIENASIISNKSSFLDELNSALSDYDAFSLVLSQNEDNLSLHSVKEENEDWDEGMQWDMLDAKKADDENPNDPEYIRKKSILEAIERGESWKSIVKKYSRISHVYEMEPPEVVFDEFQPAELHVKWANITYNPPPEIVEQLKDLGVNMKQFKFLPPEDRSLMQGWKKFYKTQNWTEADAAKYFHLFFKGWPLEQQIKILQYVGRDLVHRTLKSVFQRLEILLKKALFNNSGSYSRIENKIIVSGVELLGGNRVYSHLSKLLNRSRNYIRKHYLYLIEKNRSIKKHGCRVQWNAALVFNLLQVITKVTKCKHIKDLESRAVAPIEWRDISKEMCIPHLKIKCFWENSLYSRLFGFTDYSKDIKNIQEKVVDILLEKQYEYWQEVDWREVASMFPGFTKRNIYLFIMHLVWRKVPKSRREHVKKSLKYLRKHNIIGLHRHANKLKYISSFEEHTDDILEKPEGED